MKFRRSNSRRQLLLAASLTALQTTLLNYPASVFAAAKGSRKILILGDSLSAEYGIARGSGWVALLAAHLSQHAPDYAVVNASISGETTAGGRQRLTQLLARHQPDIVLIELGGNDALRGLDLATTEQNLRAMSRQARGTGARVALLGMQVPPNYGQRYADWFAGIFARVAAAERTALVPFLLEGVAQNPDLFQRDRIHPNAQAQPIMLANVWPILRTLL